MQTQAPAEFPAQYFIVLSQARTSQRTAAPETSCCPRLRSGLAICTGSPHFSAVHAGPAAVTSLLSPSPCFSSPCSSSSSSHPFLSCLLSASRHLVGQPSRPDPCPHSSQRRAAASMCHVVLFACTALHPRMHVCTMALSRQRPHLGGRDFVRLEKF